MLEREGDLYGPTVNLASRIVSIAYAGSVVVSGEVHDALADHPDLRWKSLRTRYLKDIGRVQLWAVRREGDEFDREGPFERARRRRSADPRQGGRDDRPAIRRSGRFRRRGWERPRRRSRHPA